MKRFIAPLLIFAALVAFLGVGLRLDPSEVPSPFIGKPAPAFQLAELTDTDKRFSPQDLRGKVWLLNVWASWCVACREEHAALLAFSKQGVVPIVGLNYKDKRPDGNAWLDRFGNPYLLSAFDADGRVGIDYGVYGVPETFVIDQHGMIRHKHVGPITPEVIRTELLPLIQELNRG
jgi:cytochrome c biogenesis protein CcmG/thiol:disulfide interchange protein DsbE